MNASETRTGRAVAAIVAELERDIIFGVYLPRQRLYEDEFILRFATKRHIVRAALQELERRGIVVRPPNRGAAVRAFGREEIEAIYELRAILHRAAAERIRLPADPVWLETLEAKAANHALAVASKDLSSIFDANTQFHRTLFEGTGNMPLCEAIEASNARTHGIRAHGLGIAELADRAVGEHVAMVKAVRVRARQELIELCLSHMQPAREPYEARFCAVERPGHSSAAQE